MVAAAEVVARHCVPFDRLQPPVADPSILWPPRVFAAGGLVYGKFTVGPPPEAAWTADAVPGMPAGEGAVAARVAYWRGGR